MTRPPKLEVRKQREVNTYAELWHASDCVLKAGFDNPIGSTWQYLSSIVLTAFAFEAYLNHVGPRTLNSWSSLERSAVLAKFALLAEVLEVDFDSGKKQRPLQTIYQLINFRNTMAHGRSETLNTIETVDYKPERDPLGESPLTDWEHLIKDEGQFASRVREDVEVVLRKLHEKRTDEKERLFSLGMGHHSVTLLAPGIPLIREE
jgi:hypothetical protein